MTDSHWILFHLQEQEESISDPVCARDQLLGYWIMQVSHHDDVIKWKHFPRHWPFVRGIHRSPVNSPHKGQWRGVLIFSLICVWINDWINNCGAGDLRRHRVHYDVIVMHSMPTDCTGNTKLHQGHMISSLRSPEYQLKNYHIVWFNLMHGKGNFRIEEGNMHAVDGSSGAPFANMEKNFRVHLVWSYSISIITYHYSIGLQNNINAHINSGLLQVHQNVIINNLQ